MGSPYIAKTLRSLRRTCGIVAPPARQVGVAPKLGKEPFGAQGEAEVGREGFRFLAPGRLASSRRFRIFKAPFSCTLQCKAPGFFNLLILISAAHSCNIFLSLK